MIKCNDGYCTIHADCCCAVCPDLDKCEEHCDNLPDRCGYAIQDEPEEVKDLTVFQNKALAVMQTIANIDRQKKELDAQDKAMRQQLQEFMDQYGIKKFENDLLKITYVEPTTRTTIDSARLKKDLPAVAEKYSKTTAVKGSVRIEVK